jgi:hypothetical protein
MSVSKRDEDIGAFLEAACRDIEQCGNCKLPAALAQNLASKLKSQHVYCAWQAGLIATSQWDVIDAPLGLQTAVRRRIELMEAHAKDIMEEEERKEILAKQERPTAKRNKIEFTQFWEYAYVRLGYTEVHSRLVEYYNNIGMIAGVLNFCV